jgi:hypothetical protein
MGMKKVSKNRKRGGAAGIKSIHNGDDACSLDLTAGWLCRRARRLLRKQSTTGERLAGGRIVLSHCPGRGGQCDNSAYVGSTRLRDCYCAATYPVMSLSCVPSASMYVPSPAACRLAAFRLDSRPAYEESLNTGVIFHNVDSEIKAAYSLRMAIYQALDPRCTGRPHVPCPPAVELWP